jgi:hypothetical protein
MIVVIIVISVIAVILSVTLGLVFGLKKKKTGGGSNGGGNHGGGGGGNHGGGGGNNKKKCNIAISLPKDRTNWNGIRVCNPCTGGIIKSNGSSYDCSGTGWQQYDRLNNSEICFPNNPDELTNNLQWGDFESEFNYTNGGYCQKNTKENPLISKPLPSRPNPNPPSPPGPPPSPPAEKGCCCCPQGEDRKTSICRELTKDTCDKYAKDGCKWVQSESLCK